MAPDVQNPNLSMPALVEPKRIEVVRDRLRELRRTRHSFEYEIQAIVDRLAIISDGYFPDEHRFPVTSLKEVADYFGTSVEYLLGESDVMLPNGVPEMPSVPDHISRWGSGQRIDARLFDFQLHNAYVKSSAATDQGGEQL